MDLLMENNCTEICGDGLNLGQYGCDDGNKEDGDGCSTYCEVEENYFCYSADINEPELCILKT